ncbi:predicted protein [Postia placenta Mad-698-R]|nr:predicted protein [Postia placenta Mad-698-R]
MARHVTELTSPRVARQVGALASYDVDVYALYNGSVQYTEATEPTVQNFARNHSLGSSLAYWGFSLVFTARIDSFMSYAMDQTTLPSSSGRDAYSRLKHSVIPRDGIVQASSCMRLWLPAILGRRASVPVPAARPKSTLGLGTEGGGRTAYAGGDALWESGGQDDGADGRRAGDAAKHAGPSANKPGDIVYAMNGKSVEIDNADRKSTRRTLIYAMSAVGMWEAARLF